MSILKVDNLTKIFTSSFWTFRKHKPFYAVNSISFQLKKGEILGLLGHNGAGKTTTIQMLLGTLTPSSGTILYFGTNFAKNRINCLKKIGYASGYGRLPARLSVIENLDIIGRIYGMPQPYRREHIEQLLRFFKIWDISHRATGTLSAGQATRVLLVKAFIANPEIVLLDEPTASLDPDIAFEVRNFILAQRKERRISLLITSHNMNEVTELCDRVLVLKKGSIIANNTPEQLAQSLSNVRLHLTISGEIDGITAYLKDFKLIHAIDGNHLTVELEEQHVAKFLESLSERKINYSHISIDKPTLEDYFLSISK